MGLFDSIAKLAKSVSDIVSDTTEQTVSNVQEYQEETRRLERQATQREGLGNRFTAGLSRHEADLLRVLVGDAADRDSVFIQGLRPMDAIHDLDSDGNIFSVRHFGMKHDVVTTVFAGSVRGRIVGDILQRTGDRLGPDGNPALKIRNGLAKQVLGSGDVRINGQAL